MSKKKKIQLALILFLLLILITVITIKINIKGKDSSNEAKVLFLNSQGSVASIDGNLKLSINLIERSEKGSKISLENILNISLKDKNGTKTDVKKFIVIPSDTHRIENKNYNNKILFIEKIGKVNSKIYKAEVVEIKYISGETKEYNFGKIDIHNFNSNEVKLSLKDESYTNMINLDKAIIKDLFISTNFNKNYKFIRFINSKPLFDFSEKIALFKGLKPLEVISEKKPNEILKYNETITTDKNQTITMKFKNKNEKSYDSIIYQPIYEVEIDSKKQIIVLNGIIKNNFASWFDLNTKKIIEYFK